MSVMTFEEAERVIRIKKVVLIALEELKSHGGKLDALGDDEANEPAPSSFRELVEQYLGGKVSPQILDVAMSVSMNDLANSLLSGR